MVRIMFVIFGLAMATLPRIAAAQVSITIPSSMDPGYVANQTMTLAGGYVVPAVVLLTILSILFVVIRRLRGAPKRM